MKKTTILLLAASLLMTSCKLNFFKGKESSSQESETETTSHNTDTSSIDLSKYEDCRQYEWFNIGLEVYTDYLGNNSYFNGLRKYETMRKGKYSCDDDTSGHFNLYVCENGDAAYDDLSKIQFFDKSEYQVTTTQFSDKSYSQNELGLTAAQQKYSFYFDLACVFFVYYVLENDCLYTDARFNSASDVYSLYGIQLQNKTKGTVDTDDESSYICSSAYGRGPSYDEDYVFTTYMNCNPSFKFVGLPPFLSKNNVTSWSYQRKYTVKRSQRIWSDSQLIINLSGYTPEEVGTWLPLFAAAGYQQVSLNNSLDANRPYLNYEADIDILGFISSANGSTTKYLKNRITLTYSASRYDDNYNPIEYSVMYKIVFCLPTVWDTCGAFVFQDDGLYMLYSANSTQLTAQIVNDSGELVTGSITKNDTIFSFFFTHA